MKYLMLFGIVLLTGCDATESVNQVSPGTGGVPGASGETQQTCNLYWEPCSPQYGCYSPSTEGQSCLHVSTKMGDQQSFQDAYVCIPEDCMTCDKACKYIDVNHSVNYPDPKAECKFSFCDPTDTWIGSSESSNASEGTTTGTKPVAKPTVNCSSYSFPGCSAVGSSTFANNCIDAGCHFSLGTATTHGDFDSPTYECRCY
jgi:hypothetical protein